MSVADKLGVQPGVIAVVGSGGKTSLLTLLAHELRAHNRAGASHTKTVILTTTTHVCPWDDISTLDGSNHQRLCTTLAADGIACVGVDAGSGRLTAGAEVGTPTPQELVHAATWVLVEADGSKTLPLKAHAPWEPVLPHGRVRTILVVGASGFYQPIEQVVHRAKRFCELTGAQLRKPATPALVAAGITAELSATKPDVILVNQADTSELIEQAHILARGIDLPVFAGSLRAQAITQIG